MDIAELSIRVSADDASAVSGLQRARQALMLTRDEAKALAKDMLDLGLKVAGFGAASLRAAEDSRRLQAASRELAAARREIAADKADKQWEAYSAAIDKANKALAEARGASSQDRAALELYGKSYAELTDAAHRWAASELGARYALTEKASALAQIASAEDAAKARLSLMTDKSVENAVAVKALGRAYRDLSEAEKSSLTGLVGVEKAKQALEGFPRALQFLYGSFTVPRRLAGEAPESVGAPPVPAADPGQEFVADKRKELARLAAVSPEDKVALDAYGKSWQELSKAQQDYVRTVAAPLVEKITAITEEQRTSRDVTRSLHEEEGRLLGNIAQLTGAYGKVDEVIQRLSQDGRVQLTDSQKALVEQVARLKEMEQVYSKVSQGVRNVFTTMFNDLYTKGFGGFYGGIVSGFRKMLQQLVSDWASVGLTQTVMRSLVGLTGISGSFMGAATGSGGADLSLNYAPAYADGGIAEAGVPAWVGERGPEIFVPSTTGRVIPTEQVGRAATVVGGGGHTFNVVNNFAITTPSPDAFRESTGQIAARVGAAIQQQLKRNGA